jgi:hypothetical protein
MGNGPLFSSNGDMLGTRNKPTPRPFLVGRWPNAFIGR